MGWSVAIQPRLPVRQASLASCQATTLREAKPPRSWETHSSRNAIPLRGSDKRRSLGAVDLSPDPEAISTACRFADDNLPRATTYVRQFATDTRGTDEGCARD